MTRTHSQELGLDHIESLCETLNRIIQDTNDSIPSNNKTIWGEYLHVWDNGDWRAVFDAYEHLVRATGCELTDGERTAWHRAKDNLDTLEQVHPRAMDIRRDTEPARRLGTHTQGATWHYIMTLREVYNRLTGQTIPNGPQRVHKLQVR